VDNRGEEVMGGGASKARRLEVYILA
jgi:hypothetical protein